MKNSFGFYEDLNAEPIKIMKGLLKNDKVTYFMVTTPLYQYTITKLGSFRYFIEKETGYKVIKKLIKSPNEFIDYFKQINEQINKIEQLQSRQSTRDSINVYERPYSTAKSSVAQDILGATPKQIYVPKEDSTCSICYEDFDTKKLVCKPTTCDHLFHCDCLQQVKPDKKGRKHCPLCRTTIYDTELVQYITNNFGKRSNRSHNRMKIHSFNRRLKIINMEIKYLVSS